MLDPSAIVLLHDGVGDLLPPGAVLPAGCHGEPIHTAAALPYLLDAVSQAGYQPAPLPSLPPVTGRRLHARARFVPR